MKRFTKKRLKLQGKKFGKLTAIENTYVSGVLGWYCECDCGGCRNVKTYDLKSGSVVSCGCIQKERQAKQTKKFKILLKDLTQKELQKLINYNPETGIFTWKERDIKYFQHCKIPDMTWKQYLEEIIHFPCRNSVNKSIFKHLFLSKNNNQYQID